MHRASAVLVLFVLTIFRVPGFAQRDPSKSRQLTVAVYNDAGVPADVLRRAEQRAANIFAQASFEVVWLHCLRAKAEDAPACKQTELPDHLALRIIRNPSRPAEDTVFGVAFLAADGSGKYSDVFWKRVQDLHAISNLDLGSILGSVMAHELGHLLLGSNGHAVSGIMRAHWEAGELQRIAMGTLIFTGQQAERMRGRAESAERKLPGNSNGAEASVAVLRR